MAPLTHLDTHVVAWLYEGRVDLFPREVHGRLDAHELWVSPIVELELQYLHEVGRITQTGSAVLSVVCREIGLRICPHPFRDVLEAALTQSWTRDPFDRVIVGHATARDADLITKDRTIRKHYPRAIWT